MDHFTFTFDTIVDVPPPTTKTLCLILSKKLFVSFGKTLKPLYAFKLFSSE
ncbi:hypothetical protein NWE60_01630 [Mycoplasmopsis felis]|nr:hypothetical protein [Mycoplasmopsis felis]WAM01331.1 hypothetical protein NWE60_01630 [Mycoplasmopsis felis]